MQIFPDIKQLEWLKKRGKETAWTFCSTRGLVFKAGFFLFPSFLVLLPEKKQLCPIILAKNSQAQDENFGAIYPRSRSYSPLASKASASGRKTFYFLLALKNEMSGKVERREGINGNPQMAETRAAPTERSSSWMDAKQTQRGFGRRHKKLSHVCKPKTHNMTSF